MLMTWVKIDCPKCLKPIVKADAIELASLNGDDRIRASTFRSMVDGWPDPKDGDEMRCPYCRSEYMSSLQASWRRLVDATFPTEWDE